MVSELELVLGTEAKLTGEDPALTPLSSPLLSNTTGGFSGGVASTGLAVCAVPSSSLAEFRYCGAVLTGVD